MQVVLALVCYEKSFGMKVSLALTFSPAIHRVIAELKATFSDMLHVHT